MNRSENEIIIALTNLAKSIKGLVSSLYELSITLAILLQEVFLEKNIYSCKLKVNKSKFEKNKCISLVYSYTLQTSTRKYILTVLFFIIFIFLSKSILITY